RALEDTLRVHVPCMSCPAAVDSRPGVRSGRGRPETSPATRPRALPMRNEITSVWRPSRPGRGPAPLALLLPIATTAAGEDTGKPAKPVVLVPPFENQTKIHESISYEVATGTNPNSPKKRYAVDRFTEAPRSLFEDLLTRIEGVTVVERQRVDAMLVESEF